MLAIGNAVRVMEIATGQREEEFEAEEPKDKAAAELGQKGEGRAASVEELFAAARLPHFPRGGTISRSVVSAKAGFLWL